MLIKTVFFKLKFNFKLKMNLKLVFQKPGRTLQRKFGNPVYSKTHLS